MNITTRDGAVIIGTGKNLQVGIAKIGAGGKIPSELARHIRQKVGDVGWEELQRMMKGMNGNAVVVTDTGVVTMPMDMEQLAQSLDAIGIDVQDPTLGDALGPILKGWSVRRKNARKR